MFQMITLWSPAAVANLVDSGEMSTAVTYSVPFTSMGGFPWIVASPGHTLALPLVPHTIHLPSLDTEMAFTLIAIWVPTIA